MRCILSLLFSLLGVFVLSRCEDEKLVAKMVARFEFRLGCELSKSSGKLF